MKKITAWPKRFPIISEDHSVCGSARIRDLDFSDWFTDGGTFGTFYLHVAGGTKDLEGTFHRVYPRRYIKTTKRLHVIDGVPYWLADRPVRPASALADEAKEKAPEPKGAEEK